MRRILAHRDARPDLALAGVCLFLAAVVLVAAERMPPPIFDPLGSAAVPKIVAGLVAAVSFGIALPHLLGRVRRPAPDPTLPTLDVPAGPEERPAPLRPGIAAACALVVAAYPGVMAAGLLGFREATILFVIALGGVMSRWSRRTMAIAVPFALVIGIGFGWLFSEVLYVDLPRTAWLPF